MTFAIISTSAVRRPSLGGNTGGGGGSSDDAAGCCSCCCLRFRVATSPDIICILELCEEGSQATRPAATAAGAGAGGPLLSCHSQWPPRPAPPRPPYPVLYMYLFLHAPLALARSLPYVCVCLCLYTCACTAVPFRGILQPQSRRHRQPDHHPSTTHSQPRTGPPTTTMQNVCISTNATRYTNKRRGERAPHSPSLLRPPPRKNQQSKPPTHSTPSHSPPPLHPSTAAAAISYCHSCCILLLIVVVVLVVVTAGTAEKVLYISGSLRKSPTRRLKKNRETPLKRQKNRTHYKINKLILLLIFSFFTSACTIYVTFL